MLARVLIITIVITAVASGLVGGIPTTNYESVTDEIEDIFDSVYTLPHPHPLPPIPDTGSTDETANPVPPEDLPQPPHSPLLPRY